MGKEKFPKEIAEFEKYAKEEKFEGKDGEIFSWQKDKRKIIVYGLGEKKDFTLDLIRKGVGAFYSYSQRKKAKSLAISPAKQVDMEKFVLASSEALVLAQYKFDKFKSKKEEDKKNDEITLKEAYINTGKKYDSVLREGIIKGEAQNYASSIADLPANVMAPQEFAKIAQKLAKEERLSIEIFDEKKLAREKMNGIVAVGQGSVKPPMMVVLEYNKHKKNLPLYCIVGKGVTFDSGGISIKPSRGMEEMKYDKSGACICLAVIRAVSKLKLPIRLVAITPLVENLPSGSAQKPGDIVTMSSGKTVEVLNTDAEGRIILGDALYYASKKKPKAIIDLATLTGAVTVCLGKHAIGLLTNEDKLVKIVRESGELEHERVWQLPLWKEYSEMIKSEFADIKNIGSESGEAGTITASAFLKEFIGETPWVHLDIAGVDQAKGHPYLGTRGSCTGARLVIETLKRLALKN